MPTGKGFVSGAALLVSRVEFEQLGGFDEKFFMYFEDVELCHRAGLSQIPVLVEPKFRVRHASGHSATRNPGVRLLRSFRSATLWHDKQGESVRWYSVYVVFDSLARFLLAIVKNQRRVAIGYLQLMQFAVRTAISGTSL